MADAGGTARYRSSNNGRLRWYIEVIAVYDDAR
jgi:hypothetical protein